MRPARLFCDCAKDAGVASVHVASTQPAGDDDDRMRYAADPDVGLTIDTDTEGDIVHAKRADMVLDVLKVDADKQLVFGWASVVEKNGVAIIDKQGDIIPVDELEGAAYDFVIHSRDQGDMHAKRRQGTIVESMMFTKEKQTALGIDLGQVGWWVGFKVTDPDLWAAHKRGERPEFSIGGAAVPVDQEKYAKGGRRHSRFPFDAAASGRIFHMYRVAFAYERKSLLGEWSASGTHLVGKAGRKMDEAHERAADMLNDVGGNTARETVKRVRPTAEEKLVGAAERAARAEARQHAGELVTNIDKNTRDVVRKLVDRAITGKWNVETLADKLAATGIFSDYRAEMIARTEVSRAQNFGTLAAIHHANLDGASFLKYWELGSNPCPICLQNEGQTIGVKDEFESGDLAPPVHPNCMCSIGAVEGDADALDDE
jgi:Putative phage serine protease XkdF/Phage Mu protein F like protein